ncbi:unnamed protein product [Spirodela intermedia]|uniref:RING-type domain-containing protein n=1 Tax=Spirodela intermedia TaxID=51605 RepID=A0A7I8JAY6_SPIIN|nr:unnamed protein product [Spirodela intermedia]CAA6667264.1 unnamed protein product [Spirodela intermedia]
MTCPLCHKLFRDATTISECLHTFCRKCIYEKLTEEEVDFCPTCKIDLGCSPVEKLRPDHNLQDVRAKLFPLKRRRINIPEVAPVTLPIRRKERSLSSLVVSTPRMATQSSLTGRRTKATPRKATGSHGDPIRKEDNSEEQPESTSSAETLSRMAQSRKQNSSSVEPSNQTSTKDLENGGEASADITEMWKPLNCLVEAANRTKSFKVDGQSSVGRGQSLKLEVQHDGNKCVPVSPAPTKARRIHGVGRKRGPASRELGATTQALPEASCVKQETRISPIWFSLTPARDQEEDARLPQISASYVRIKDCNLPVLFIQKYLAKKLDLASETEVEITCRGQPVSPALAMWELAGLWLQAGPSQRAPASIGTSAEDFVMALGYARRAISA